MKTVVNKDGSVTTTVDDVEDVAVESKVVEPDEKPTSKTRSRAEHK